MKCKNWCKNNFSRNCKRKKEECGGCQECSETRVGQDIEQRVKEVIGDQLGFDVEEIRLDDNPLEDLGGGEWDMGCPMCEIWMTLEEEFNDGFPFEGDYETEAVTVQDMIDVVENAQDGWKFCAYEDEVCSCVGGYIRYGSGDVWTDAVPADSDVSCSNSVFGDPYFNAAKQCQCANSNAALAKENQALLQQNAQLMERIEAAVGKRKRKRDSKDSKESEDDQETPEEPEAPEQPETPEEPETPEQPEEPEAPEQPEEPEAPEQPEEMECKRWCKNNFTRNCRKKKDDCGGCQECAATGTVSDSIQTAMNGDVLRYAVIFFATVGAFTIAYYISKAIFKVVSPNHDFQAIKDIEI